MLYEITSQQTGKTYYIEGEGTPTEDDMVAAGQALDAESARQAGVDPAVLEQGPVGTFVNTVRNIGPELVDMTVGGVAKLNDAIGRSPLAPLSPVGMASEAVRRMSGAEQSPLGTLADATGVIREEGQRMRPVNPFNETARTVGGAVNQIGGMIATGGLATAAGMAPATAMTAIPGAIGFAAGAGQGVDTAQEMGITDPTTQAAMGAAFGGVEMLTERIGGIGGDVVDKFIRPSSFVGKAAMNIASESGEELLAGRAQDALTVAAGQTVADPQRPGFTQNGYQLPSLNPLNPDTLARMKQEAIGGAAGGVIFSGLQGLANRGQAQTNDNLPSSETAAAAQAPAGNQSPAPASQGGAVPDAGAAVNAQFQQQALITPAPIVPGLDEHVSDLTAEDVADLEATAGQNFFAARTFPTAAVAANAAAVAQGQQWGEASAPLKRMLQTGQGAAPPLPAGTGRGAGVFFQPPQSSMPQAAPDSTSLLAPAYEMAARGQSTAMLPLASVFAAARQADPTLTAEAFADQIRQAYEANQVMLEGANSQQEIDRAGFVIGDTPLGTVVRMAMPARVSLDMASQNAQDAFYEEPLASGSYSLADRQDATTAYRRGLGEIARRAANLGSTAPRGNPGIAGLVEAPAGERFGVVPRNNGEFHLQVPADFDANLWAESKGNGRRYAQRLNALLFEEQVHMAQLAALRTRWEKAGRPGNFNTFITAQAAEILQDMQQAGARAMPAELAAMQQALHTAFKLYFDAESTATPEMLWQALNQPWMLEQMVRGSSSSLLLEFMRQMIQMQRTGVVSETASRTWLDKLKQWIRDGLDALKRAYRLGTAGTMGAHVRDFIAETEALLNGDANALPFIPDTLDDGAAGPIIGASEMGPPEMRQTRSRFARPDEQEQWYETRADEEVKFEATGWLDSRTLEAAIDQLGSAEMPPGITSEDVRQQALGMAIRRAMVLLDQGDEFARSQARVLANRAARLYQDAGREAARSMRQRAVVNHELMPHAPILAAEKLLIDRADRVMDKRFDGGAKGGAAKTTETAATAGAEAGAELGSKLNGEKQPDTPAQRQAREKINQAQRTAQNILDELSRRYADPPVYQQGQRLVNAMRELYKERVRTGMAEAEFVRRAMELGAAEGTAGILWEASKLEIAAREMIAAENARKPLDRLLSQDSPALAKLLNELQKKMFPGMNWQTIFEELPSQQRERQRAIYQRLRSDERLRSLTQGEALQLTNELDKAWQRERRTVFLRAMKKAGALGAKTPTDRQKVEKAYPKLLRAINLGLMTSETFREAVAPEYGLKMITQAQAAGLRTLAEKAYTQPPGILRNKLLADLLSSIQKTVGVSRIELLNSYWTAAVLSGLRTQFDTFMAAANGLGTNLIQTGLLAGRGRLTAAKEVHAEWWRGFAEGVKESLRILAQGDYSYTKRFNEDLQKALEGDSHYRPVPISETYFKEHTWGQWQKYPAAIMLFVGRAMTAADHINNTATTRGAMAVARALHPELYGQVGFTTAEREAAMQQALHETTGGNTIGLTNDEKATLQARAREILFSGLNPEHAADANETGNVAAYQNDPTGVFGWLYDVLKSGLGRGAAALGEVAEDVEARKLTRAMAALVGGALYGVTGTRFMRFGFNFGADLTRYVPGTYLAGMAGFYGREVSPQQRDLLLGKNVVGLMVASTVAALFAGKDDDEDGWHMEGPWNELSLQDKAARRSAKLEPLTFWKRNQDGSVSKIYFKQWPTMGILAAVGGAEDARRFQPEKFAQRGLSGHLGHGLATGLVQIENVSAMRNLGELFAGSFTQNAEDVFLAKVSKTSANYVGGFVPRVLKDIDAWIDPQNYKPEGWMQQVIADQPIVRRLVNDGRPQLSILGKPVELNRAPWSRMLATNKADVEEHLLAKLMVRGINLPGASDKIMATRNGERQTLESMGGDVAYRYQKAVGEGYAELLRTNGQELLTLPADQAQKWLNRAADSIKSRAMFKAMQP
jgi:hypothetical protein